FDYLRDNLAISMDDKVQRGHNYAIVDEVDNILIDEARTPLIISGQPEQAADLYYKFAKLAPRLIPGKKPEGQEGKSKEYVADFDYEPDEKHKTVAVTERGVEIQEGNQTVATITYQNYFRRYDKLAGMTGTAITEATEFMKIYELQVVEIPTNRPMVRKDQNDQIYKTKEGKWKAVAKEIAWRHEKKQPVLVGTISVEVSELLSERLKQKGIPHTVLNAKPEHAEREGEIVAEAGRPGGVTIATNMAGRGVDIKLGGNAEHLTTQTLLKHGVEPGTREWDAAWDERFPSIEAEVEEAREKVTDRGGLFILGTERHESRRIDNQLRGRSGRQG